MNRSTSLAAIALLAVLLALVAGSYLGGGVVATLADPATPSAAKVEALRQFFLGYGALAPLVYVGFVTVEVVVAPIPGLMLYAPGGVVFGGFWGGLLSLIGNVIGAGLAFGLMRVLGGERIRRLIGAGDLGVVERRLADNGAWVVFLLRVNPITSSDLVSYAAGLTSMRAWKLLVGTAVGMAPLCWLQAYTAEGLLQTYPWLLYPLVAAALGYLLLVLWLLVALRRRHSAGHDASTTDF